MRAAGLDELFWHKNMLAEVKNKFINFKQVLGIFSKVSRALLQLSTKISDYYKKFWPRVFQRGWIIPLGRFQNLWRWTYTRWYSRVTDEEQKKVLGVYIGNSETCTRYSRVTDEEQKKRCGGDCHFKLSKGGGLKKEFGKPCFSPSKIMHLFMY